MTPGSAVKTNIGIFIGILVGWVIYYEPFGILSNYTTWGIAVAGLLFHAWGCYNYVVGKGHTPVLALIGLAPLGIFLSGLIPGYRAPDGCIILVPIGLLVLAILPDLTKKSPLNQRAANYHGQNSRFAPPPPPPKSAWTSALTTILVVAALGIVGWIAYQHFLHPPLTVEQAQHRAVQQYPDLGVPSSPLNREFLTRYRHYQATNPAYFNDQGWPLHLAAESQAALAQGAPTR